MSWVDRSWDINLDDIDEEKYFKFIGEEWLWYELSSEEVNWIETMGKRRDKFGKTKTKVDYSKGDSAPLHISGVAGEYVIAKLTGLRINQIELTNKAASDLGEDIEVKSTRYGKNWAMYVNEKQMIRGRRYICTMTYLYPKYVCALGWAYGRQFPLQPDALPWRESERAFRLGYHSLNPIHTLEIGRASL